MLCACADSLSKAIAALGSVGLNATLAGNLAAGLNANAGLVAAANATAAANASLTANAALAGNMSAAANASANLKAMASISALATFCLNAKRGFGIDMGGNAAPAELSDLLDSLVKNAWNKAISKFPLDATPKLKGLADLASAMDSAASLGINVLGPNAQAKLNAAASAAAKAKAAADAKASASLGISASAGANLSATLSAAVSANATLKAAFNASLGFGMSAGGLGESLKTVNANMASLPNFGAAFMQEQVQKLLDLLDALGAIKRGFNVDLTVPGAGKTLDAAISEIREKTDERIYEKSLSESQSKSESRDFTQSHTEQQDLAEALDFARSKEFNKIYGKGVPGVPKLANLLAMLANRLLTETGISMAERAPCGMACLFIPFLPPMCLCPKVKLELPRLPSLSFQKSLSGGLTPLSVSASSALSTSTSAKASANLVATTTPAASAQGSAGAQVVQATGQVVSNTNAKSNEEARRKGSSDSGASSNTSSS